MCCRVWEDPDPSVPPLLCTSASCCHNPATGSPQPSGTTCQRGQTPAPKPIGVLAAALNWAPKKRGGPGLQGAPRQSAGPRRAGWEAHHSLRATSREILIPASSSVSSRPARAHCHGCGLSVNVPSPPSLPGPVVPRGLAGILRGGWAHFFSCEQLPTPKQGPGSQRAFRVTKVGQPGSDSSVHVQEGRHPVDVCPPLLPRHLPPSPAQSTKGAGEWRASSQAACSLPTHYPEAVWMGQGRAGELAAGAWGHTLGTMGPGRGRDLGRARPAQPSPTPLPGGGGVGGGGPSEKRERQAQAPTAPSPSGQTHLTRRRGQQEGAGRGSARSPPTLCVPKHRAALHCQPSLTPVPAPRQPCPTSLDPPTHPNSFSS